MRLFPAGRRAAPVTVLLALALTGCGGGGDSGGESGPTAAASAEPTASPSAAAAPLEAVNGTWQVTPTVVSASNQTPGPESPVTWKVDLDCQESSCTGTVVSTSGRTFQATWDGTELALTEDSTTTHECGSGTGTERTTQKGTVTVTARDDSGAPTALSGDLVGQTKVTQRAPDCQYDLTQNDTTRRIEMTRA